MFKTIISAAFVACFFSSFAAFAATTEEQRAACMQGDPNAIFIEEGEGGRPECRHAGPGADLTAPASQMAHTFEFEGDVWTILDGPAAEVSAVHLTPGAAQACPSRTVRLEASDKGPEQTAEQRFRGDQRWHVICAR